MRNKIINWIAGILILISILIAVSAFSLSTGSVAINLKKLIFLIHEGNGTAEYNILFNIRLPRILLGFAIGGSLSLAGVILQGMFRNPLVEPYTLGISGGAALGVCLSILLGLGRRLGASSLALCGFIGAVLVIMVVYSLSMKKGALKIQGLLLTGVMVSFISSSLVMLMMAVSRSEDLHGIIFWIMGSLEEPSWALIKLMVSISLFGLFVSYLFCLNLNALSLGEEDAAHLGIRVERTKNALFLLTALLTGCSVAVAGIIGFVGLVVPHAVRMVFGSDHRIVLAASFLTGSAFLILCDTLSRTIIAPMELPVGVITGIVGGSIFVYALSKKNVFIGDR